MLKNKLNDMIFENKNKLEIIKSAVSPYKNYCMGYPGQGPYFAGFVIGTSAVPIEFGDGKSLTLDEINAFDTAEVDNTYLGQTNMITVSSFCGPHGLLWGYDIAHEDSFPITEILKKEDLRDFSDIDIRNGKNLRIALQKLFGTKDNKNFPLLPGSHVPTAQKFVSLPGPVNIYGAFAVGIPEERNKNACLFMEDIGIAENESIEEKKVILKNVIRSVKKIGENQGIIYKTIYADTLIQNVRKGEIGGALVAAPYFLLAQEAYSNDVILKTH